MATPNPGDIVQTKYRIATDGIIIQSPAILYFVSQVTPVTIIVSMDNYPNLTITQGRQLTISLYDVKYILSQVDNSIVYDGTVDA